MLVTGSPMDIIACRAGVRFRCRPPAAHLFGEERRCASVPRPWAEDLWVELTNSYFDAHADIFERLGVACEKKENGVMCRFTEDQARAYMLLHVFMHELGHHHDRMNQKHHGATKGEDYAERFATSRFDQLFPAYVRIFGDPARAEENVK